MVSAAALALDFALFGNGNGLGVPYFDGKFYWLDGRFYIWQGWLGAQLASFQWCHPRAGERRRLNDRIYVVLHSSRRWFRVRVAWCLVGLPDDASAALAMIRQVRGELDRL